MLPHETQVDSSAQREIAHVLFMDIVGYSATHVDRQPALIQELQDLVRATTQFRRAEASGELISLPTGDGMALVFFRDPVTPVECALELARALRALPHLRLRMGLHSGPVYRVQDINAHLNVSGGGINLAQQVMAAGDAGHILLSGAIQSFLHQLGEWPLRDLGQCDIKHGQRVQLFNLSTAELGNPSVPIRLRPIHFPEGSTRTRPDASDVVILYKRHARPDEEVLGAVERGLVATGRSVFIDRHLSVGVEWAREIEREVRSAGAVIVLLSAASIQSEMLAWEVQSASEAAAANDGPPRLLPVRVQYQGALGDPLDHLLNKYQAFNWSQESDTADLLQQITRVLAATGDSGADALDALPDVGHVGPVRPVGHVGRVGSLESPNPTPSTQRVTPADPATLEPPGGAVPLDSPFYVTRPTDAEFSAAVGRHDSIVLIKGARQMGKTSLLARGNQQARATGSRVVVTDFQKLNASHLESVESLYLSLCEWIGEQLDLDLAPDDFWSGRRGASVNFERFWRREVLGKSETPVIWALDEVDRLFTCSFGSEVFGLFRSWHNERALDPSGPWSRLTLAIAYATEAHLFITDLNQSPFNVGTWLEMRDFTFEQVADLNHRYAGPLSNEPEVARFFRLVSGQPYLVRRGLHELASQKMGLAAFEMQADREEGVYGDHLRRMLVLLARDPELTDVVRGVLRAQPCPTAESFYRLRAAGVMSGESARDARPRCQLYANYLGRHLL